MQTITKIILDKGATIFGTDSKGREVVGRAKNQEQILTLARGATMDGATVIYDISHFPTTAIKSGYARYNARVAAILETVGSHIASQTDKSDYVTITVEA